MIERAEAAYPEHTAHKDWQALKKIARKNPADGRRVGRSLLAEAAHAGAKRDGRAGNLAPKLILPALLLAFLAWHCYAAVTRAGAHPVYLVSGAPAAYTVAVNGETGAAEPRRGETPDGPRGRRVARPGGGPRRGGAG